MLNIQNFSVWILLIEHVQSDVMTVVYDTVSGHFTAGCFLLINEKHLFVLICPDLL